MNILSSLGEVAVALAHGCQGHETPAPKLGEVGGSAPLQGSVEEGAPGATPHPGTPPSLESARSILNQSREDFLRYAYLPHQSQLFPFFFEDSQPEPVAPLFESEDHHP